MKSSRHGSLLAYGLIAFFAAQVAAEPLQDSRVKRISNLSSQFQQLSDSVAIMVSGSSIQSQAGTIRLKPIVKLGSAESGADLCKGEAFGEQYIFGSCTTFLIAADLMVTAGHCFEDEKPCHGECANPKEKCGDTAFVFGIKAEPGPPVQDPRLPSKNVYHCREVLYQNLSSERDNSGWNNGMDMTLIRLDRKVEGHEPLIRKRISGTLKPGDSLIAIGSPRGTPMMSTAGKVKALIPYVKDKTQTSRVTVEMWNAPGFSGGPVFNEKTGLLEGIFTGGGYTRYFDPQKYCYHWIDPDDPNDPSDTKNFGPKDPKDPETGVDVHSHFIPMSFVNSILDKYQTDKNSPANSIKKLPAATYK